MLTTDNPADTAVVLPGIALRLIMADTSTHDVRVVNPDRIRYDLTRQREGWPKFTDAGFLGLTFLGWAALTRTAGKDVAGTWEKFAHELCLDVVDVTATDGGDDTHPSRPALAAGI